ncbi:hypothetical protein [Nostoc sp. MG11]|uniref:hypothetical protein n=1 Tax=Nostoc sp. MG11 TaxID=2721166 RepID=UPI001865D8DC|nr:hypothetical protein [Nostoc sp. MG11]
MSENDKQGNFWTTLPGIITALTGIITATGGLIASLHATGIFSSQNTQSSSANPPQIQTNTNTCLQQANNATFEVKAYNQNGCKFKILNNKNNVKAHFHASGEWAVGKAADGFEYVTVEGYTREIDESTKKLFKCPDQKLGALIYIRKGKCYHAGEDTVLPLEAEEEINFYINDHAEGYNDNRGIVKVTWDIAN